MNVFITIIILAAVQEAGRHWGLYFKSIDALNLYTNMIAFSVLDIITIKLISRFNVRFLTNYLCVILCFSIMGHAVGGYLWTSYHGLKLYEGFKIVIFCLEIMGFILYGISKPDKGRRKRSNNVSWSGIPGLHILESGAGRNSLYKKDTGRDS